MINSPSNLNYTAFLSYSVDSEKLNIITKGQPKVTVDFKTILLTNLTI